jgi:hypothetical protein
MNCHRAGDLLSPYLEGELNAARAAAVEEHLRGCARCRAEEAALRRAVAVLRTPPPVQHVDLLADFKARLEAPSRARLPLWPVLVPTGALAALLLGGVVLYQTGLSGGPRTTMPSVANAPAARRETAQGSLPATRMAKAPELDLPRASDLGPAPAAPAASAPMGDARLRQPIAPSETARPASNPFMSDALAAAQKKRSAGRSHDEALSLAKGQSDREADRRPGSPSAGRRLLLPPGVAGPEAKEETTARGEHRQAGAKDPVRLARADAPPAERTPEGERSRAGRRDALTEGIAAPEAQAGFAARENRAGGWVAIVPARRDQLAASPSPARPAGAVGGAPAPPAAAEIGVDAARDQAAAVAQAPSEPVRSTVGASKTSSVGADSSGRAAPRGADDRNAAARTAKLRTTGATLSAQLFDGLRRPVNVMVADVPLTDLLQRLSRDAGIPIMLDPMATAHLRAHADLRGLPLHEALQKVAEAAGMTIVPHGGGVSLRPAGGAVDPKHPAWSAEWGGGLSGLLGK